MFHMLTCFHLKPNVQLDEFRTAYSNFVKYMQRMDLVVGTSPVGERQNDTKMDTDKERDHKYYVIMSFRDRGQVDAAHAHLRPHAEPAESVHKAVYSKAHNPIFICWQDIE